jgi:hypothetical protein
MDGERRRLREAYKAEYWPFSSEDADVARRPGAGSDVRLVTCVDRVGLLGRFDDCEDSIGLDQHKHQSESRTLIKFGGCRQQAASAALIGSRKEKNLINYCHLPFARILQLQLQDFIGQRRCLESI